jgi:hypothetical protein
MNGHTCAGGADRFHVQEQVTGAAIVLARCRICARSASCRTGSCQGAAVVLSCGHLERSVTMAFKTEFEFTLPRGYVDKDGNVHKKGVMRLATAKDEILPLQDYRVQNNRAYLVIILLSRVIETLGTMKSINPSIIESMFSADLAYLQDFYRRINEEGTALVKAKCPECGHQFEVDTGGDLGES